MSIFFTERVLLLTCGTPYDPWLLKHRRLFVLSFGLTKMFCVTSKHRSLESEVEVVHSVVVSFIMLCITMEA